MVLRVVFAALVTVAAPAAVWWVCGLVIADVLGGATPAAVCDGAAPAAGCENALWAVITRWAGVLSGAAFLIVIAATLVFAAYAGANRRRNAAIFPTLAPVAVFLIGTLVLLQGAAVTGAAYLWQAQFLGSVSWIVLALLGGGALIGGVATLWGLGAVNKPKPTGQLGKAIPPSDSEALWRFVDGLAETLGAQRPTNIVVGLDPTFYATAAPVAVPTQKRPLKGETLYLSLPLMRLFTEQELRAVVGHELGHFRGDDTAFSLKFAPVYRRLISAYQALAGENGRGGSIATLPARMVLGLMIDVFARNERRISRAREFAADQAGVSVSSPAGIALSLAKTAVYAPLWGKVRRENAARLSAGKISRNLSKVYEDSARFDVSHRVIEEVLDFVLEARIEHPTDTHPPIAQRYEAVGFKPDSLTIEALTRQGDSASALFPDLEAVEAELTLIEHQFMVAAGAAKPPKEAPAENQMLNAAYILAATLICADGRQAADEIAVAEGIGGQLLPDFDAVSFRETFEHLDDLPPFLEVVRVLDKALEPKHKALVHAYLAEIAAVDGVLAQEEAALLRQSAEVWGLSGWRNRFRRRSA